LLRTIDKHDIKQITSRTARQDGFNQVSVIHATSKLFCCSTTNNSSNFWQQESPADAGKPARRKM